MVALRRQVRVRVKSRAQGRCDRMVVGVGTCQSAQQRPTGSLGHPERGTQRREIGCRSPFSLICCPATRLSDTL